jgi:hypothetical protein
VDEQTMAPGSLPATASPWARFDRLASNVFVVLALAGGVVALLVLAVGQNATTEPAWLEDAIGRPAVIAAALVLAVAGVGLFYGLAAGLDRGAAWARPAAVYVLIVVTLAGLAQVVLDLGRGRLTVPLGTLLAIWVLSTRPARGTAAPAGDRDRRVVAGVTLLAVVIMLPTALPWWWVTW